MKYPQFKFTPIFATLFVLALFFSISSWATNGPGVSLTARIDFRQGNIHTVRSAFLVDPSNFKKNTFTACQSIESMVLVTSAEGMSHLSPPKYSHSEKHEAMAQFTFRYAGPSRTTVAVVEEFPVYLTDRSVGWGITLWKLTDEGRRKADKLYASGRLSRLNHSFQCANLSTTGGIRGSNLKLQQTTAENSGETDEWVNGAELGKYYDPQIRRLDLSGAIDEVITFDTKRATSLEETGGILLNGDLFVGMRIATPSAKPQSSNSYPGTSSEQGYVITSSELRRFFEWNEIDNNLYSNVGWIGRSKTVTTYKRVQRAWHRSDKKGAKQPPQPQYDLVPETEKKQLPWFFGPKTDQIWINGMVFKEVPHRFSFSGLPQPKAQGRLKTVYLTDVQDDTESRGVWDHYRRGQPTNRVIQVSRVMSQSVSTLSDVLRIVRKIKNFSRGTQLNLEGTLLDSDSGNVIKTVTFNRSNRNSYPRAGKTTFAGTQGKSHTGTKKRSSGSTSSGRSKGTSSNGLTVTNRDKKASRSTIKRNKSDTVRYAYSATGDFIQEFHSRNQGNRLYAKQLSSLVDIRTSLNRISMILKARRNATSLRRAYLTIPEYINKITHEKKKLDKWVVNPGNGPEVPRIRAEYERKDSRNPGWDQVMKSTLQRLRSP